MLPCNLLVNWHTAKSGDNMQGIPAQCKYSEWFINPPVLLQTKWIKSTTTDTPEREGKKCFTKKNLLSFCRTTFWYEIRYVPIFSGRIIWQIRYLCELTFHCDLSSSYISYISSSSTSNQQILFYQSPTIMTINDPEPDTYRGVYKTSAA